MVASKILASWNKANTTLQREEKKIRRHYASAIEATAKMPTYLGEWWFRKLEKLLTAHQELWQRAEKVVEWALKEEKNRLDAAEVQDVKEQADVFEFRRPIRPEILRIRRSRLPDLSQLEQAQRLLNASVAEQQMIVDEALVDASAIPAQAQARATRKQICPLAIKDGMVYVEGVPVPLAGSTMDGAIAAKFFLSVLIEQNGSMISSTDINNLEKTKSEGLVGTKWKLVKRQLPKQIRDHIAGGTGQGYWITPRRAVEPDGELRHAREERHQGSREQTRFFGTRPAA
ncbi:MAG: hypothetical protein FJ303_12845 [Planctomycetes bacterium]|nr:hypothetical protein [Planctomycetota bacterium]